MSTVDLVVNNPPCPTCTQRDPGSPNRLQTLQTDSVAMQWCPVCGYVLFERGQLQAALELILARKGVLIRVPRPHNATQDVRMAFPIGVNPQRWHNPWPCPVDNTPMLRWSRGAWNISKARVNICERGCTTFDGNGPGVRPSFLGYVEAVVLMPYSAGYQPAAFPQEGVTSPLLLWG